MASGAVAGVAGGIEDEDEGRGRREQGGDVPVYEYWDRERNVTVELRRPVAERDCVPANLERITVPRRLAIHGTSSSPLDEESADFQAPRALKALSNGEVNQMVRESGMSREKYKEVWNL